jgi:Tfp pilus assembly protein PilV
MVEFLLAAFIMGIGLLGLAALQGASLSQGTGGRLRGTASFLAHSIFDRIEAEASVTRLERWDSGVVATTGWVFIGAADGTAKADAATLKFDIQGNPLPDNATDAVILVNWLSRAATITPGAKVVTQEFVVNVSWKESGKGNATLTKALSVSRYVRI